MHVRLLSIQSSLLPVFWEDFWGQILELLLLKEAALLNSVCPSFTGNKSTVKIEPSDISFIHNLPSH